MAGHAAFGTILALGSGTVAGTAIANITRISGPNKTVETIDVTAHDSAGAFREILPTFISSGDVTLELNYEPSESTHLVAVTGLPGIMEAKTLTWFRITYPTPVKYKTEFQGYVTEFSIDAPFDDKISATCTIAITGSCTTATTS